jgi:hypothetical protein
MSLYSGAPARLPVFQLALLALAVGLCGHVSFAQQPKVLAPHRPVPAVLSPQNRRCATQGSPLGGYDVSSSMNDLSPNQLTAGLRGGPS